MDSKKCVLCGKKAEKRYYGMKEWKMEGVLCGDCYSKRLHEHYPGDHVRMNK